ncbi:MULTISPECIES: hypothetical protein [Sphingomonadales]|uniref:Uncharacterized protein n=2 Tax=Edaphosphingomonas TaxID=3423724 RepID=A0A2T4I8F6_9SPHN|nr:MULTISPECIES: hypothetical protein [Sphingomonas]AGH49839.1 hypothetical protein G432_10580 [Sphingomonas sp. MM-1]OHT18154.1 hypothetical protein BHE75_00123 [Sphingomonas haloaromaticamans]PTD28043.1 hypothetical protein CV103_00325 [Sphingomonas fennica]
MKPITLIIAAALAAAPAYAGNSLIPAGRTVQVAKSAMAVTPGSEWNKLGRRPGTNGEIWTLDGDKLNRVTFYGGIAQDTTLFREVDRKNSPLPRFSQTMLLTDVPKLLENSYRVALGSALFTIDQMEPARFGGVDGIRFTYSFVAGNQEVQSKGEARAAIVKGRLYMISYEAPALHFFEKNVAQFRQIADSATF